MVFFRTVLTTITLIVSTLVLAPVGIILIPLTRGWAIHPVAYTWGKSVLLASGVKIRLHHFDKLPRDRPVIYMLNHQGAFDIYSMCCYLPYPYKGIAKKELFKIPLFGWAIRAAGFIPIDRSNRVKAIKSIEKAKSLFKRGYSLVIFPEGTRSLDGHLGRLKKGGFHLAMDTEMDIVPITISGCWKVQKKGSLWIHPGPIDLTAHDPIPTKGYTAENRGELITKVREALQSGLTDINWVKD